MGEMFRHGRRCISTLSAADNDTLRWVLTFQGLRERSQGAQVMGLLRSITEGKIHGSAASK